MFPVNATGFFDTQVLIKNNRVDLIVTEKAANHSLECDSGGYEGKDYSIKIGATDCSDNHQIFNDIKTQFLTWVIP